MTDKQKIKHAISVLQKIENQHLLGLCVNEIPVDSISDLRVLLETKHEPEAKEPGRATDTWEIAKSLCCYLHKLIKKRKPNFRQIDLFGWATEMDKIIRIDQRTPGQIAEVIAWSQQHDFWKNNILSPSKLRKQLDTLELQMSNDHHWQRGKLQRRQNQTGPTEKQKYMEQLNGTDQEHDEGGD